MESEQLEEVYEELFLYGLIRWETLESHVQNLRPYLIERASDEAVVTYQNASDYLGTSRQYLGRILGAINECEARRDNPLLTAIVVRDEKVDREVRPSLGFFTWPCIPEEYRVHPDSSGSPSEEQLKYWNEERDRVWSIWAGE